MKKGKPQRLYTGKRYMLVTAADYSLPVRVIGSIDSGGGTYILLKTTR